jgi:glycosyltransferase involved in cell wall biosynthesis
VSDVRPPKDNIINKVLHLNHTDHFIFSCRANRDRYLKVWPLPVEKTSIIYGGIDTQYFIDQDNKLKNIIKYKIPLDNIIFGIIARLSPVKDHLSFLKAAALLSTKVSNAFFIVSGEEVEIKADQLRQISRQLGIYDKVLFLEKSNDVREIIQLVDVGIVCSSGSEAVSRITAEFLSMAKPVIVSRINVLPEMITDGHDGFIVPPGSPENLSRKMQELVINPQLLLKMKENARKTAEVRFSYHRFYEDTIAIYKKVIATTIKNCGPMLS